MQSQRWFAAVLILALLGGCAATPKQEEQSFDDLYDGRPELAFSTLMPVESAEQGIARADRALARGDTDLALFEYVRSLRHEPENGYALFQIGQIHRERGNTPQAVQAWRLLLSHEPDHARGLEQLGLLLLEHRHYEEATALLRRSAALDATAWRVHNALGVLADLAGDHQQAGTHYREGLRIAPRSATLLNNYGYSAYLAGDTDKARRLFGRALAEDREHERAWHNLGLVHAREGRIRQAITALRQVMSDAEAHNSVGYILLEAGNFEAAERLFRQAIELSPHYYVAANRNLERLRELRGGGEGRL